MAMKLKILFVCTGNICRSPAAEEVFRQKVIERGLADEFHIDSAGMHGFHEGELPDRRMRQHAAKRGYKLTSHSRPIQDRDYWAFDYIIYMDDNNRYALERLSPDAKSLHKLHRMTDYCKEHEADHVPDPYYGGEYGFELVLDLLEDACEGLLEELSRK
jgi:Protein-tyrosine-phosphatase